MTRIDSQILSDRARAENAVASAIADIEAARDAAVEYIEIADEEELLASIDAARDQAVLNVQQAESSGVQAVEAARDQAITDIGGLVTQAEAARDDAVTAKSSSESARDAAQLAEGNAASSATSSATSATESAAARDKSEKWAEENEDIEVELGQFSAKHHSAKAEATLASKADLAGGADANFTVMPQVGGSPIVESDSNNDGEWTRWADGTQICWHHILVGRGNFLTAGVYITHPDYRGNWIYPQPMTGIVAANGSVDSISGRWLENGGPTTTGVDFYMIGMTDAGTPPAENNCAVYAIGRWV